jgi:hypothetical protein
MTVFAGAVDATFAAFGIDASYTPAGGEWMLYAPRPRSPAGSRRALRFS